MSLSHTNQLKRPIIIVGAGPIGLAYAYCFKILNKDLDVVVYEKYPEYARKHVLQMQAPILEALMKATGTTNHPILKDLLQKLKKDKFIRTSEVQNIFTRLAEDNGVKINYKKEIVPNQKNQLVIAGAREASNEEIKLTGEEPLLLDQDNQPLLVIGADGTHSVISQYLFPEGNQHKDEFDYVLQFRYEISGKCDDKKNLEIIQLGFTQDMLRHGVIANEYVGNYDSSKNTTPVTMQMMITKEVYNALENAKSKTPINLKPVQDDIASKQDNDNNKKQVPKVDEIPDKIQSFLTSYVNQKKQQLDVLNASSKRSQNPSNFLIDLDTITISVNEAPATHAKNVFTMVDNIPIYLAGDAALGLSYFKGLNAGLEATAEFFKQFGKFISNLELLTNPHLWQEYCSRYEDWFLTKLMPKKVSEVAKYSKYRIGLPQKAVNTAFAIKQSSYFEVHNEGLYGIINYSNLTPELTRAKPELQRNYPHRSYDPIKFGEFGYVPIRHTLQRLGKQFADYVKPYKSFAQVKQDFKQPLVGLVNAGVGIGKILAGAALVLSNPYTPTKGGRLLLDGIFSVFRGTIELVTFPLAWTIKPLMRSIVTGFIGKPKLENNKGVQKIVSIGQKYLQDKHAASENLTQVDTQPEVRKAESETKVLDTEQRYRLTAICNDLHRKFRKGQKRGQTAVNGELTEAVAFKAISRDPDTVESYKRYLNLFVQNREINNQPEMRKSPGIKK